MMDNKTLKAVAILIGTTVGAGFFGIPFAVTKVGFLIGAAYLLFLGLLNLLLNLIYGEVILRTPGDHQLTGYGQIYFGKLGKAIATMGLFIGLYGALLAYLIKIGEFISLVSTINLSFLFSLIFFVCASTAVFFGLKIVSKLELFLVSLMLIFVVILTFIGLPNLQSFNFTLKANSYKLSDLLFPYGVIFFALSGYSAIPEMEEVLRKNHAKLKKSIIIGSLIPLLVYFIFTFIVVGISGKFSSEDAISGLKLFLPNWIVRFGAGLGILTMSTSFLAIGYVLHEVWYRDFRLSHLKAFCLAVFPPLIIFLIGVRNFIQVLELAGALTSGLIGILIVACFFRAQKQGQRAPDYSLSIPKAILLILGLVLILGMFSPFL